MGHRDRRRHEDEGDGAARSALAPGWRWLRLPGGDLEIRDRDGDTAASVSRTGLYRVWETPGRPMTDEPTWIGRGKDQHDATRLALVVLGEG